MSWQSDLFDLIRDRQWYQVGELFEICESQIPLHLAMRRAMAPSRYRTELPTNFEARLLAFRMILSVFGVETETPPRGRRYGTPKFQWNTRIRLRYLANRSCPVCRGPVIKASWSIRAADYGACAASCLACEKPPAPVITFPGLLEQRRRLLTLIDIIHKPIVTAAPAAVLPQRGWVSLVHNPMVDAPNVHRLLFHNHRDLARAIKRTLGFGSINGYERELDRNQGDGGAILHKHGMTITDLYYRLIGMPWRGARRISPGSK